MSDLISREDLKKSLHNFFDGKDINEPAYILRDVFCIVDNAPTMPQVEVFAENASKEEIEDFKQELEAVLEKPQGEVENVRSHIPTLVENKTYEKIKRSDLFQ